LHVLLKRKAEGGSLPREEGNNCVCSTKAWSLGEVDEDFPIKVETTGHGRSFTSNLETRLIVLGRDFGGAAVDIGEKVHGFFKEECTGKKKESGVGPRS